MRPNKTKKASYHRMCTSPNDPKYWQIRAEETRVVAERTTDPQSRQQLFRVAAGYDALAQRAVERSKGPLADL
jgi:hypothetical protein